MILISGIQPGHCGVGRVMTLLLREASEFAEGDVSFIFGHAGGLSIPRTLREGRVITALKIPLKRYSLKTSLTHVLQNMSVMDEKSVILLHHQTLGAEWCMEFIKRRSNPTWLYLMDAGFFCIRSYNYIPGEDGPCLRCIGGNFTNADTYGCKPYPVSDGSALEFLQKLHEYVASKRVYLLAQNRSQASLARKHFGSDAVIKISGMWAEDWDTATPNIEPCETADYTQKKYNVVYHGAKLPAKGWEWTLEVARICPEISFLFPFALRKKAPENCSFIRMTWEKGLREEVCSAGVVIVPSLWSAPIEGTLVKSIALAKSVAVVNNPTSFSGELLDDIVLRLPTNVEEAAKALKRALSCGLAPEAKKRDAWFASFAATNRGLLKRLAGLIHGGQKTSNQDTTGGLSR